MTLKIVHHKEQVQTTKKDQISLNIEKNLKTMFLICEKIVNFAYLISEQINYNSNVDINTENINEHGISQTANIENLLAIFSILVGKKLSLIDAVAKATAIMQKISKLANDFGVSLKEEEQQDPNTELLTDEDIDIMVQMVKDFGEQQIREDSRECREKFAEQEIERQSNNQDIDVYDVYHDD